MRRAAFLPGLVVPGEVSDGVGLVQLLTQVFRRCPLDGVTSHRGGDDLDWCGCRPDWCVLTEGCFAHRQKLVVVTTSGGANVKGFGGGRAVDDGDGLIDGDALGFVHRGPIGVIDQPLTDITGGQGGVALPAQTAD